MAKEFKKWIDEFVENGANPADVAAWSENSGSGEGTDLDSIIYFLWHKSNNTSWEERPFNKNFFLRQLMTLIALVTSHSSMLSKRHQQDSSRTASLVLRLWKGNYPFLHSRS